MMRRMFGRVINIVSIWGQVGAANEVAYSAVKAGLIGFTKALAKEVGSAGITVNAVSPGVIVTDMLDGFDRSELEELPPRRRSCASASPRTWRVSWRFWRTTRPASSRGRSSASMEDLPPERANRGGGHMNREVCGCPPSSGPTATPSTISSR